MAFEWTCKECPESFREDTVEGVLKRAAAHAHDHHAGPASLTPEIEAALRAQVQEV